MIFVVTRIQFVYIFEAIENNVLVIVRTYFLNKTFNANFKLNFNLKF